jgi:DNA polymerase I-like protein with 3'-5' exonuclease and polymerase domains
MAGSILFEWIVENNMQWIVLMCNSVHDELVAEAPDEYAEVARHQVEQAMLVAGNHYLTNLKIKADADIGPSWGEAKK